MNERSIIRLLRRTDAEVERLREEIDHLRNPSQGETVTMQERIDTLTRALQRSEAAVQAVRDAHPRTCSRCVMNWHCPDLDALDAALGGERDE